MKLKGTIETDFGFAFVQIHFGEKERKDFGQVSFPQLGDMHNDVSKAVITDTDADFEFEINNMPSYIHFSVQDDSWQGTFELPSLSMKKSLVIKKISDEPDFCDHYITIPEVNIQNLKKHNEYINEKGKNLFEYELNNPEVLSYIKELGIETENHHDFAAICALMNKTCQLIHHDGVNKVHDRVNRGTIAQIKHAQAQENMTNCRGVAIIFCGVLRAYGFKANVVECRPLDPSDKDLHVVCEVYVEEYQKTVLLDPSNNLIYYLEDQPLSLIELKEALVHDRQNDITINPEASHNGNEVDIVDMLAYMSKNLFYLRKAIHSDEVSEMAETNSICLTSKDLLNDTCPKSAYCTCNIQDFYLSEE